MPGRSWNREKCAAVESTNPVSLEPGGEQNTTEGDPMASAFLLPELPPNKPRGVGCGFSLFAAGSRVATRPVPSRNRVRDRSLPGSKWPTASGPSCHARSMEFKAPNRRQHMSHPRQRGRHEPGCQTVDFSTLVVKCCFGKMPAHPGSDEGKQSRCSTCACSADRSRGSYSMLSGCQTVLPCRAHSALRSPDSATHCTK